jgi:hypothetical protein
LAIYSFRTNTYARNIYIYGTTNFASIPLEYHVPVKQRAAELYSEADILNALNQGWITQQEHDETLAYKSAL